MRQFLFLLLIAILSACSPKSQYQVLSFFFDGVPDSTANQSNLNQDSLRYQHISDSLNALAAKEKVIPGHPPYLNQECARCHERTTTNRFVMDQPGLCYTCHQSYNKNFKFLHGPVASGYCTACHSPHLSELPHLLKRKDSEICLLCHETPQTPPQGNHPAFSSSSCLSCHNPHGGNDRYFLK